MDMSEIICLSKYHQYDFCVYIYSIYVYEQIYMYKYICTNMYTNIYVQIHVYKYICANIYVQIYTYM